MQLHKKDRILPLSYSSLINYLTCPERYKKHYFDNLKNIIRDVDDIKFGSACHIGFSEYDTHLKTKNLKRSIRFLKNRTPMWFAAVSGVNPSRYEEFSNLMVQFARYHRVLPDEIYGSEIILAVDNEGNPCKPDDNSAFLVGQIDRLDIVSDRSLARIVDYKTNRSGQANSFQLMVYSLLVAFHFPDIRWFELIFEFPRLGGINSVFRRHYLPVSRNRNSIIKVWRFIKEVYQRIRSDTRFAPQVSTSCQTCPYTSICTAKPYAPVHVNSDLEAKELGKSILILENRLKVFRDSMKLYIDKSGPVDVNDRTFNLESIQQFVGDIVQLLILCKDHRINPRDLFTVNSLGLKQLMKDNRDAAELIANHVLITVNTKLTHKKSDEKIPFDFDQVANHEKEVQTS